MESLAHKGILMQLRRRRHLIQPNLLFMDSNHAELWTSLSQEQQQACRDLLSQLLQQVVRPLENAAPNTARRTDRERQALA
jgi:hypothetical protein